ASQSSAWSSLTHRPTRLSWCHGWWEDEGGHAGLRVARAPPGCAFGGLVVQLMGAETGVPVAARRADARPIPSPAPARLPRYQEPESPPAFLPRAKSSWACSPDRKRAITNGSLPAASGLGAQC